MTEIEIKFRVDDLEAAGKALILSGGRETARFFEDNILYDDRSGALTRDGKGSR